VGGLEGVHYGLGFAVIAVLRYVDLCPGMPCRVRRPRPSECRPNEIYFGHRVGRVIPRSVQLCPIGSTFVRTAKIRYVPRAVGLMEVEHLQQFSDMLTLVRVCRVARGDRFRQIADRNEFRSLCRERDSANVQPRPLGSTFVRTAIIRSTERAVGLMQIENLIRYAPLAVGLNKALGYARQSPPARAIPDLQRFSVTLTLVRVCRVE